MTTIYLLPSALRALLLLIMCISSVYFTVVAAELFTARRKNYLLIAYFISLAFALVVTMIVRTPLIEGLTEVVLVLATSLFIIPMGLAACLIIKTKRISYTIDLIAMFLNMPVFFLIPYWSHFYILLVGYIFVRVAVFSERWTALFNENPGLYSIKESLDLLDCGLVFANKYGQIEYINDAMNDIFYKIGIKEYLLVSKIIAQIQDFANHGGRILSDTSVMVYVQDKYYIFSWRKNENSGRVEQLICRDVTQKEQALVEIEKTNERSFIVQQKLIEAFGNIERVEKENETIKIKGNLHDIMAQRLSILHSVVSFDNNIDLVQLKGLLSNMLPEMRGELNLPFNEKLAQLTDSFALVGVKIIIDGNINMLSAYYSLILKILRECTTNAIKHGGASEVYVTVKNLNSEFFISVSDNGINLKSFSDEGNGIKGLRYSVEQVGGKINVYSEKNFVTEILLPYK